MALRQSVATKATVTTTKEIKLAPQMRKKLLMELREFQTHKAARDAADAAMNACKAKVAKLRESTGEKSIEIDGFKSTLTQQTRKVLDHKKLIAAGCAQAWIEEATDNVPSKAYEKITCPGEQERD